MLISREQSFEDRQVAFSICSGMPADLAAKIIGCEPRAYRHRRLHLIRQYGFDNMVEFAVNVNAAVRSIANQR